MTEDPVPILARFHREVLLPDVKRAITEAVEASEQRRRDEMRTLFDSLAGELKDLRELYTMLNFAVKRVEERLEGIEPRLDKVAFRSELQELKGRVEALQEQVRTLESRLDG